MIRKTSPTTKQSPRRTKSPKPKSTAGGCRRTWSAGWINISSIASDISPRRVQRLIKDGLVKVNGKTTKASYHPRDGDEVEMVAPPKPVSELVPEPIPLDIVYEDEHFLALNKQADLIVHPARGKWTGTLVNGLVHYGSKWSKTGGDWRPGILHRLDRNTTGIMLVAKSDEAHWRLARQFENRTIQKTYMAVIHGVPPTAGRRDRHAHRQGPLHPREAGRPQNRKRRQAGGDDLRSQGKSFATVRQPMHRVHGAGLEQKFAVVRLSPKTGRTHQLRVHMAAIGCPIVGDTTYGGRVFESGNLRFERQALHAYEITFVHPATLKTMTLSAPLPQDMTELLQILRARSGSAIPSSGTPGEG